MHRDEAAIARWLEPLAARSTDIAELFAERLREVRIAWRDGEPREARVRRESGTSARWRRGAEERFVFVPGADDAAAREAVSSLRAGTGREALPRRGPRKENPPEEEAAPADAERWAKRLAAILTRHAPRHRLEWRMLEIERRIVAVGRPPAGSSRRLISLEGTFVASSRLGDEERSFSFHAPHSEAAADDLRSSLAAAAAPRDRAVPLPDGVTDVLLADGCAAVLFHEILGHALEADVVSSPLAALAGARVAATELEVVDDPRRLDLFGGFEHDDEGTAPRAVKLLQAGAIGSRLTDRAHAAPLGGSTGHGRRAGAAEAPGPRGSNVVVRGGGATAEEIARRLQNGVRIAEFRGGSVELANGTFRLEFPAARRIRRGRPADELGPGVLAGEILSTLRNIEPVLGRDVHVCRTLGWCARDGRVLPVQGAAPDVIVRGLAMRARR